MTSQSNAYKPVPCLICGHGRLQQGKLMFISTDSFFVCDHCHSEYHREKEKYRLKHISSTNPNWQRYEGQVLSWSEIDRLAHGGLSDAEIARRDEAERQRRAKQEEEERQTKQRQEEEKRLRETPGTPQFYLSKFKTLIGVPEDSKDAFISFGPRTDVKQNLARIRQLQKELRLLKKEINQTIKLKRMEVDLRYHTRSVQQTMKQIQLAPYEAVVKLIDDVLVKLDGLKLKVENPGITFETDSEEETQTQSQVTQAKDRQQRNSGQSLEELLKELNSLIGLQSVKQDVAELVNFLKVQQIRKAQGMPVAQVSLHMVFYGNPGTGKTSVARLLAQIYKALNILSNGQLVETDRSGLVAGYVGQTALKVREVANQSLGGILFIDEAYSLVQESGNDFGKEAVDTLLKFMEDHRDDLIVIAAGYTSRMDAFLSSNPGLRSRFNKFMKFDDYTANELVQILERFCQQGGFQLSSGARQKALEEFQLAYEERNQSFGNARFARNLFESAISNQANRIISLNHTTPALLAAVEAEDISSEDLRRTRLN